MPVPTAAAESVPFADRTDCKTDFRKRTMPLDEIQSGGPPKDGIPPVDRPQFEDVSSASKWLKDAEPVVLVVRDRDARAYPLQTITWHEIVNDTIGGAPAVVTFCPLCNTAIAFERRFDALTLDFGTKGKLRNSDLVMYDRQTGTWWQQITGEGIVGAHAGRTLEPVPAQIVSCATFASSTRTARSSIARRDSRGATAGTRTPDTTTSPARRSCSAARRTSGCRRWNAS
ncbi:MAG: DUF3179 domain-containing protein [Armatimonadetes bacterium]|nr:DUF3179 domain-containing protein [Armatimonadota bacterium]